MNGCRLYNAVSRDGSYVGYRVFKMHLSFRTDHELTDGRSCLAQCSVVFPLIIVFEMFPCLSLLLLLFFIFYDGHLFDKIRFDNYQQLLVCIRCMVATSLCIFRFSISLFFQAIHSLVYY